MFPFHLWFLRVRPFTIQFFSSLHNPYTSQNIDPPSTSESLLSSENSTGKISIYLVEDKTICNVSRKELNLSVLIFAQFGINRNWHIDEKQRILLDKDNFLRLVNLPVGIRWPRNNEMWKYRKDGQRYCSIIGFFGFFNLSSDVRYYYETSIAEKLIVVKSSTSHIIVNLFF